MKLELTITKEFEVKTLHVSANVRYWEDSRIDGIEDVNGDLTPCRLDDSWCPLIDVDSGQIINWVKGTTADIHFKICDAGSYELRDDLGNTVKTIDGYVPEVMCPAENGYGDYIIMHIDGDGIIKDWNPCFDEFGNEED